MKQTIAYILLISCLILSAHSLMSFIQEDIPTGCCTECSAQAPEKSDSDEGDCDNKLCNPFTQCTCCAGFLPAVVLSYPENIQFLSFIKFNYSENLELQFISDHWQPPKFG